MDIGFNYSRFFKNDIKFCAGKKATKKKLNMKMLRNALLPKSGKFLNSTNNQTPSF